MFRPCKHCACLHPPPPSFPTFSSRDYFLFLLPGKLFTTTKLHPARLEKIGRSSNLWPATQRKPDWVAGRWRRKVLDRRKGCRNGRKEGEEKVADGGEERRDDGRMERWGARFGSCRCWRRMERNFIGAVGGGEGRKRREIGFLGKEGDQEEVA